MISKITFTIVSIPHYRQQIHILFLSFCCFCRCRKL